MEEKNGGKWNNIFELKLTEERKEKVSYESHVSLKNEKH